MRTRSIVELRDCSGRLNPRPEAEPLELTVRESLTSTLTFAFRQVQLWDGQLLSLQGELCCKGSAGPRFREIRPGGKGKCAATSPHDLIRQIATEEHEAPAGGLGLNHQVGVNLTEAPLPIVGVQLRSRVLVRQFKSSVDAVIRPPAFVQQTTWAAFMAIQCKLWDVATEALDLSDHVASLGAACYWDAESLRCRGELSLARGGEPDQALELLQHAIERADELQDQMLAIRASTTLHARWDLTVITMIVTSSWPRGSACGHLLYQI